MLGTLALRRLAKGAAAPRIRGCHSPDGSDDSVWLAAWEAVKRKLAPRAGRGTVRMLPVRHALKPWREKEWG